MSVSTNSLVAKVKKFAIPSLGASALLFSAAFLFNHNAVHAAAIVPGAPMDESSVSSLEALDNAVEAVAARVTPAVVNVSVTAHAHGEDGDADRVGSKMGQWAVLIRRICRRDFSSSSALARRVRRGMVGAG
jgi:serine protease Do